MRTTTPPRRPGAAPAVRFDRVTRRFGALIAADAVSLELRAGEVHCLLGENGAGKSTLVSLLAGGARPDSGRVEVDGEARDLAVPGAARALGIGVLHQHSMLVPGLTVLENLMLADRGGLRLRPAAARERLRGFADVLGEVDPGAPVERLGSGQRRLLELARVLWDEPRVLVLDEPSARLGRSGAAAVESAIVRLRERGAAVLLVTHRIGEALRLGDRLTVLRRGRVVLRAPDTGPAAETGPDAADPSEARIVAAMFGDAAAVAAPGERPAPVPADAPVRLRLTGARVRAVRGGASAGGAGLHDVDLEVRAGEIVGVAGMDGHGQRELAEAVAGQRRLDAGRILLDGRSLARAGVAERRARGLRYVTDERLHEGVVGAFGVEANLLLKEIGRPPYWRLGFPRRAAMAARADALIADYDIRTPARDAPAAALSGGNLQKLLLARELSGEPAAAVVDKPGTGLDAATARRAHAEIRRVARAGAAVLLISPDLDELAALAHRVVVLADGRLVGAVSDPAAPDARARIGALIAGAGARRATGTGTGSEGA